MPPAATAQRVAGRCVLRAANVARALLAVLAVLAAVGVALICLRGPLARLRPGLAAGLPVRTRRCSVVVA